MQPCRGKALICKRFVRPDIIGINASTNFDLYHGEQCILAYISDFQFIGSAAQSVGLSHTSQPRLGMLVSSLLRSWVLDSSFLFLHAKLDR
jgi:hypothetical protein